MGLNSPAFSVSNLNRCMLQKLIFVTCDQNANTGIPPVSLKTLWKSHECLIFAIQFKDHPILISRVESTPNVCSRTSGIQVHLYYICLTNFRGHIQNRVFICVCKGMQPLFSSSPGQTVWTVFTHTSTCIILCTSHNWSMTVTSCIRCFSIYFLHRFYAINVT